MSIFDQDRDNDVQLEAFHRLWLEANERRETKFASFEHFWDGFGLECKDGALSGTQFLQYPYNPDWMIGKDRPLDKEFKFGTILSDFRAIIRPENTHQIPAYCEKLYLCVLGNLENVTLNFQKGWISPDHLKNVSIRFVGGSWGFIPAIEFAHLTSTATRLNSNDVREINWLNEDAMQKGLFEITWDVINTELADEIRMYFCDRGYYDRCLRMTPLADKMGIRNGMRIWFRIANTPSDHPGYPPVIGIERYLGEVSVRVRDFRERS